MTLRATRLWIALTALCSLVGCASRDDGGVPPAPVIVPAAVCPAPDAPALPRLDAALPFDAPDNVRTFLERDDLCRHYIKGLQATIRCYESQIQPTKSAAAAALSDKEP